MSLLIQFVPSPDRALEGGFWSPTDLCLSFLRIGMGRFVVVSDLTFSETGHDLHVITRVFFLFVAFSIALPFTLIGIVFYLLESPDEDEDLYEKLQKASDLGGYLKLREDYAGCLTTLKEEINDPSTDAGFKELIVRSSIETCNLLLEGIEDLPEAPQRRLLIDQLRTSIFENENCPKSNIKTPPFETSPSSQNPMTTPDTSLKPEKPISQKLDKAHYMTLSLWEQIYEFPLSDKQLNDWITTSTQEFLRFSGVSYFCRFDTENHLSLDSDEIDEDLDLFDDLLNLCPIFQKEIENLMPLINKGFDLQLFNSLSEQERTKNKPTPVGSNLASHTLFQKFYETYNKIHCINTSKYLSKASTALKEALKNLSNDTAIANYQEQAHVFQGSSVAEVREILQAHPEALEIAKALDKASYLRKGCRYFIEQIRGIAP